MPPVQRGVGLCHVLGSNQQLSPPTAGFIPPQPPPDSPGFSSTCSHAPSTALIQVVFVEGDHADCSQEAPMPTNCRPLLVNRRLLMGALLSSSLPPRPFPDTVIPSPDVTTGVVVRRAPPRRAPRLGCCAPATKRCCSPRCSAGIASTRRRHPGVCLQTLDPGRRRSNVNLHRRCR
jgi:hypothetical protein